MINQAVTNARRTVKLFRRQLEAEPWKKDHEDAMQCLTLEGALRVGTSAFDTLVAVDQHLRGMAFEARAKGNEIPKRMRLSIGALESVLRMWLEQAGHAEHGIRHFESLGYEVAHATEFRQRHAEADWILADDRELFADQKFADARDDAVDHLRARPAEGA